MSPERFGQLVAEGMEAKGLSQRRLGALVGILPDGRIIEATQIRLIIQGQRKNFDPYLVERLVVVLDLDPADAYPASGTWPPDLDPAAYRRLVELRRRTPELVAVGEGVGAPSDQGGPTNAAMILPPGRRLHLLRPRQNAPLLPVAA